MLTPLSLSLSLSLSLFTFTSSSLLNSHLLSLQHSLSFSLLSLLQINSVVSEPANPYSLLFSSLFLSFSSSLVHHSIINSSPPILSLPFSLPLTPHKIGEKERTLFSPIPTSPVSMPSLGGLLKKRRTKDSQTLSKELQESGSSIHRCRNTNVTHSFAPPPPSTTLFPLPLFFSLFLPFLLFLFCTDSGSKTSVIF